MRPGEELTVSDGAGGRLRCRFGPALEPVGQVERMPRSSPEVTVAFAVVKGERPEWAVQKLTEIGVDRIIPLLTAAPWCAGRRATPAARWPGCGGWPGRRRSRAGGCGCRWWTG